MWRRSRCHCANRRKSFWYFSPEEQAIARRIFLQPTELGEGDAGYAPSRGSGGPCLGDESKVNKVLDTLVEARLVTLNEDTAEVAHEALIREWSRLRDWLNQDREALRLHRRLAEAAQAWERSNRDEGKLDRGARLAQALDWAQTRDNE